MPARLKSANSLLREVEADLRKQADHAEDRFKERLPSAPPALLSQARQAATRIPPGPEHRLHLPLLEGGQVQGFAAYKRVGKRGKPVLATILGPHMEPRDSHLLPSSLLEKAAANRMGKILGAFQRGEGGPQVASQAKALLSHPTTSGVAHAQMAAPKSLYDLHLDSLPLRPMGSPSLLAAEAAVSRDPINLMRALNTRDPGVVAAAAKNPHANPDDLKLVHALRPDFAEANPATHLHRLAHPVPGMTHHQAAAEVRDGARRAIHRSAASELARQRLEMKTATDLTEASRDKIKDKNFALPGRRYPIHDMNHARAALSMVSAHGTPEEKTQVRAAVASRYPGLAERSESIQKEAANRITKIMDQARKLAPASITGTLAPGKQRVLDQAEALMLHPATSAYAEASLHRPKSLFDLHLDGAKPVVGNLPELMAEARNPTTSAPRLAELAGMRHQPLMEAAAVNPAAGAGMEYLHQIRPDLADANPTTDLLRLVNGGSLPKMDPAAFAEIKKQTRRGAELPWTVGNEDGSAVRRFKDARTTLRFSGNNDRLPLRWKGRALENMRLNPLSGGWASDSTHPIILEQMSPITRRVSEKLYGKKEAATKTQIFAGLRVRIDRPKGYVQKGKDTEGKPWERVYKCDYGYLAGTQGGDGDGMDVFLGPDEGADAFLIWQKKADGSFDEYKLMLGFKDAYQAKAMYLQHVPAKFMGKIERVPVGMLQGLTGKQVDHSKVAAPAWMRKVRQGLVQLGEVAPEVPHLPTRAQARNVGSALKEDPMSVLSAGENSGAEGLTSFRKSVMSPPASEELTPRMRHHIGTTDAFLRDAGDHFVRSTGLPLRISESPPSPAALAEVRAKGYPDHFAIPVTQTDTPIHAHTGGPLARPMGAHEMQEVREMGHLLNPPPTGVAAARTPGTPFTSHLGISPILEENLQNWEIPAWQRAMGSARGEVDGIAMNALGSVGNTPWAPTSHDSRASRGAVRAMEHKNRQLEKLMGGSPDARNAAAQRRQDTVRIGITRGTEGLLEKVPPEHREMVEGYLRSFTPEPTRRIFPRET